MLTIHGHKGNANQNHTKTVRIATMKNMGRMAGGRGRHYSMEAP
jgi:hypothetical protein